MTYKPKNGKKGTYRNARSPQIGVPVNTDLVIKLMHKHRGIISYVAEEIGCARQTIDEIMQRVPEVRAAREAARERLIDLVEETYIDKAVKGDTYNGTFLLKTLGRKRGYDADVKESNEVLKQVLGIVFNKSKKIVDDIV